MKVHAIHNVRTQLKSAVSSMKQKSIVVPIIHTRLPHPLQQKSAMAVQTFRSSTRQAFPVIFSEVTGDYFVCSCLCSRSLCECVHVNRLSCTSCIVFYNLSFNRLQVYRHLGLLEYGKNNKLKHSFMYIQNL